MYDIWSTQGVFKTRQSSTPPPPPPLDIDERTLPRMYTPKTTRNFNISIILLESSSTSSPSIFVDTLTSVNFNFPERTLFSSNTNPLQTSSSSDINARKMATTATLTAVSSAGTTNCSNSTDTTKRKSEENLGGSTNRKPTHRRLSTQPETDSTKMKSSIDLDDSDGFTKTSSLNRTAATFRIPKLGR